MKTSLSLAAFAAAFATSFAALAADAPQGSSGATVAAGGRYSTAPLGVCTGPVTGSQSTGPRGAT